MEHPTVLVFVEFPDPEFPSGGFLSHLAYPDAEIVGFYHPDDDESIEEAEAEHRKEFTTELQKQSERFEQQGVRTECDLVFDYNRVEARQRVADRDEVDAILIPGGTDTLGKLLIAARHTKEAEDKVATLLNTVNRDDLISVDLVHIADPDDPDAEIEAERILKEMTSVLTNADIPSVQINREVRTGKDVSFELSKAARNYDLVVLGETEQDLGDKVFGPVGDYIVDEQDVPVLIVR